MRVLITGAAGFVGGHLIKELQKQPDTQIHVWVLNEAERRMVQLAPEQIEEVDITDAVCVDELIEKLKPQVVYHLAAQSSVGLSWKKPALTYHVNIVGTTNLLESLSKHVPDCKVLLIGSAEQYGPVDTDALPISEKQPLQGCNPYSISKMAQEQLAQLYLKNSDLSIIRIRAFNHIGPGQDVKFVIPDWCSQIVAMEQGEKPPVLYVGNVTVKRDFTDVRDIVYAYVQMAQHGRSGEIYNVGSGVSTSLQTVLEQILSASSRTDLTWKTDEKKLRPADVEELRADVTKLKETIDWKPKYTLTQSIEDILAELRGK